MNIWARYAIIVIIFFLVALLQTSFFPYFAIFGATLNGIFVVFFLLLFFGESELGFFSALVAGFFLDVSSPSYFGLSIIALLAVYLLQIAANHFFKRSHDQYLIIHFTALFLVQFVVYNVVMYIISLAIHLVFPIGWNIIPSLVYNLMIALGGFYIARRFIWQGDRANQLKLL